MRPYPPSAVVLVPLLCPEHLDAWLSERLGPGGAEPPAKFRDAIAAMPREFEPPYLVMPARAGEPVWGDWFDWEQLEMAL
jgi:hypothetical protein